MKCLFILLSLLFYCFCCTSADVIHAEERAPFADAAEAKKDAIGIPRKTPRTLNLSELFQEDNIVVTSYLDVDELLREDAEQKKLGPLRMGVVQEFEPRSGKDGKWTQLGKEGHLWTYAFIAPGAVGIRLRIKPWNPPSGSELIVYDALNPDQSFGPFGDSLKISGAPFWTPTLYTNEVKLEYYLPDDLDPGQVENHITIDALLNQYRGLPFPNSGSKELPCHLDVTCYPAWAVAASGVGALSYINNPYGYFCTGCLLNRNPTDWTPYLLTNWHCGIEEHNVKSLLVTWFFQSSTCDGAPPDPATLPQTAGAIRMVHENPTDTSLVGLRSDIPGGVYYQGWDAGYWSNDSASTGIHHPAGTYKRITFGTKTGDLDWWPIGYIVYNPHGNGELEPGSSGSPVFDSEGRVRGSLQGANWDCETGNDAVYGRFDVVWPKLQPYLQPTDPIYVDGSFSGEELGTLSNPFNSVHKGVFAVISGSDLYVEAGSYDEQLVIEKPMTVNARNGVVVIGQ